MRSERTDTSPITIVCSVNDFVNECPLSTVVPIAERLPCGEVVSVDDVCATGLMFTGELPPPRYSGRCNLASGLVTLKWFFITSIYLEPPRAYISRNFCVSCPALNVVFRPCVLSNVDSCMSACGTSLNLC